MTEYVILRSATDGIWESEEPAVKIAAPTSRKAIQKFVEAEMDGKDSARYVAVPARSWQPVKVQVETALKFST